MFPIVVFLESLSGSECDTLAVACGTFVYVFSDFFAYLLRFEVDGIDFLMTITTIICHISALRVEVILTLLPKRRYVHEVEISSRHEEKLRIQNSKFKIP
jgi:hypothetical protein